MKDLRKQSFPFYCCRRLVGDVVDHAVHVRLHLVGYVDGDALQDFVRHLRIGRAHPIDALDGADGNGLPVNTIVSLDTYRLHRQQDGEILPFIEVDCGRTAEMIWQIRGTAPVPLVNRAFGLALVPDFRGFDGIAATRQA